MEYMPLWKKVGVLLPATKVSSHVLRILVSGRLTQLARGWAHTAETPRDSVSTEI